MVRTGDGKDLRSGSPGDCDSGAKEREKGERLRGLEVEWMGDTERDDICIYGYVDGRDGEWGRMTMMMNRGSRDPPDKRKWEGRHSLSPPKRRTRREKQQGLPS